MDLTEMQPRPNDGNDNGGSSKPDRRRRRPALSCVSCRRAKVRCDRKVPCSNCVRSRHRTCFYDVQPPGLTRSADSTGPSPSGPRNYQAKDHGTAPVAAADVVADQMGRPVRGPIRGPIRDPVRESSSPSSSWSKTNRTPPENAAITAANSATSRAATSTTTSPPNSNDNSHGNNSNTPARDAAWHVDGLLKRIQDLESRLDASSFLEPVEASTTANPYEKVPSVDVDNTFNKTVESTDLTRSVMSKTRYFGQSHWINGVALFKPVLDIFEVEARTKDSEIVSILTQCKALARTIKSSRISGLDVSRFGANIPPRPVADQLVDGYLRTLESVYRILHLPTFHAEYERYWAAPQTADTAFVIQLQLVMAIGCAVYDDEYTLRNLAVQWVQEARTWLNAPSSKKRLTLAGLQVMMLLCYARETSCIDADLVWIPAGALIRSAMYMGLHRDPSRLPNMNQLKAELRRRLWNTILEISVQSSLTSGGPPMITMDQFDTAVPANCDDSQLRPDVDDDPAPSEPADSLTDMSAALALRDSLPVRLAVARSLNDLRSRTSYEDTLRLHNHVQAATKNLARTFRAFPSSKSASPPTRHLSDFQRRLIETILCRNILALHVPYLSLALHQPAYSFSRKTVVDMAVKVWRASAPPASSSSSSSPPNATTAAHQPFLAPSTVSSQPTSLAALYLSLTSPPPPPPPYAAGGGNNEPKLHTTAGNDLARLSVNGTGSYRTVPKQGFAVAALELRTQALENDEYGGESSAAALGGSLRPDLMAIVREAVGWNMQRLRAGETSIKSLLIAAAFEAHIDGMIQGLGKEELRAKILARGVEAGQFSAEFLGAHAAAASRKPGRNATGIPTTTTTTTTTGGANAGVVGGGAADGMTGGLPGWDPVDTVDTVIGQDWDMGLFYDVTGVDAALDMDGDYTFPSEW